MDGLPAELVARIFREAAKLPCRSNECPPILIICQVCAIWNYIALSTPDLWTEIRVPFAHSSNPAVYTQNWLRRSKACLFAIVLDIPKSPSPYRDSIQAVLFLVVSNIDRLQKLTIHADGTVYSPEQTLAPLKGICQAPQLQHLDLCFWRRTMRPPPRSSAMESVFPPDFVPRLVFQRIHGLRQFRPLPNLTALDLFGLHADETFFCILNDTSPHLQRLVLRKVSARTLHPQESLPRVTLPSLTSLAVSNTSSLPGLRSYILPWLFTPNLEYLELAGSFPKQAFFSNPAELVNLRTLRLNNFITNHSFSLNSLLPFDPAYLHAMSNIEQLDLIGTIGKPILGPGSSPTLRRSRSINLREHAQRRYHPVRRDKSPVNETDDSHIWPNLQIITLDSIRADDLVWLCEIVSVRPQIETVKLSHSSFRHLANSILLKNGQFAVKQPAAFTGRFDWEDKEEDMPVEHWLRSHVQVSSIGIDENPIQWDEGQIS